MSVETQQLFHLVLRHVDGFSDLLRLADSRADVLIPVADDDEHGKLKALASLDDLAHTIDSNNALFQVQGFSIDSLFDHDQPLSS